MALFDCSRSSSGSLWSSEAFADNFSAAAAEFDGTTHCTLVGSAPIGHTAKDGSTRFITWESMEGELCLREETNSTPLANSACCVRFGASPIVGVSITGAITGNGEGTALTVSVVLQDGCIHVLHAQANNPSTSVLEPLVFAEEGSLVNLDGLVVADMPHLGLGNRARRGQRNAVASGSTAFCSYRGQMRAVPDDRDILCCSWLGERGLVVGLSRGDLVLVTVAPEEGASGMLVGQSLQLTEHLLRQRSGGLQALWSNLLLGSEPDANSDTIAVGACSASALAVSRCGDIRVWSADSRQLVAQVKLHKLLECAGRGPGGSAPGPREGEHPELILRDCIVSVAADCEDQAHPSSRFLLAAVGAVPDETSAVGARASGLVVSSASASQQAWQVLLVGWNESSRPGGVPDEPQVVAQPILFPLGAPCAGAAGTYTYRSAALVDVHLEVNQERAVAVVTTCWRAEVVRSARDASHSIRGDSVVVEGLVGISEVPLEKLRYVLSDSARTGASRLSDLADPTTMRLVAHSAELEKLRASVDDDAAQRQLEDSCLAGPALRSDADHAVKACFLPRIFLRRRFSRRAICAAYDAFAAHTAPGLYMGAEESKGWTERAHVGVAIDRRTPDADLPHAVAQLCHKAAAARHQASVEAAGVLGRREVAIDGHRQYVRLLIDCYRGFIRQCDLAAQQLSRVSRGAVSALPDALGPVRVVARRAGVHSLVHFAHVGCEDNGAASILLAAMSRWYADPDSTLPGAFAELGCLLEQYLTLGDVTDASAQWVPAYFASLFSSQKSACAGLADVASTAPLDALLACADPIEPKTACATELLALAMGANSRSGDLQALRVDPAVLVQLAVAAVRERVHLCMLSLTLLSCYLTAGTARASADVQESIRDFYVPQMVKCLLKYSALLWMDARRPTDSHMLREEVEVAALVPLGVLRCDRAPEPCTPSLSLSVLENFIHSLCSSPQRAGTGTEMEALQDIFGACQLSPHCALSCYLWESGQYVSLSRWAALMSSAAPACNSAGSFRASTTGDFLCTVSQFTARVVQTSSELLELLRLQWLSLRSARPSRQLEQRVAAKVRQLFDASAALAPDDAQSASSSVPPSPITHAGHEATGNVQSAVSAWLHQVQRILECAEFESDQVSLLANCAQLDGALVLVNALASGRLDAKHADGNRNGSPQGARSAADATAGRLGELKMALSLTTLQDALEMVERLLPLLPRQLGADLALDGALLLAARASSSLDPVAARSSPLSTYRLMEALHGAWSRAFEYSLWHGGRYDEALDALVQVAELEEQRLVDGALSARGGLTWRDSLRALVMQACEAGRLGWLCSVPEQQLQGHSKQRISLGEAISCTLESVAAMLDLPSTGSAGAPSGTTDFYECLLAFQLSRRNFRDGARVMLDFCARCEIAGANDINALHREARALAAATQMLGGLPGEQAYVLQRATGRADAEQLRCSDQASLAAAYLAMRTRILLSGLNGAAAAPSSLQLSALALCNGGHVHAALSHVFSNESAPAGPLSAQKVPLAMLAKACVSEGLYQGELMKVLQLEHYRNAPFTLATVPGDPAQTSWKALVGAMRCLVQAGIDTVTLQDAAVQAVVALQGTRALATLQLPRSFVDALCCAPGEGPDQERTLRWNPAVEPVLRMLVDRGVLLEACGLATRLTRSVNDGLQRKEAASEDARRWMPYSVFDQLLALEETALEQACREAFVVLRTVLRAHFALLLLNA